MKHHLSFVFVLLLASCSQTLPVYNPALHGASYNVPQPMAQPTPQSFAQPTPQPVVKPAVKPVVKPAVKSVEEPAAKPSRSESSSGKFWADDLDDVFNSFE